MEGRFLILLTLVLRAGRARGSLESDVTASCCSYYKQMKWDDYSKCVDSYGIVPVCDGSRQGCYYGNRFYTIGETVAIIPSKCLKLMCSRVTVPSHKAENKESITGDDGQLVANHTQTVQMQVVYASQGCGCCEHEGHLYPNRTALNLDRTRCAVSICLDGKWVFDTLNLVGDSLNVYPEDVHERLADVRNSLAPTLPDYDDPPCGYDCMVAFEMCSQTCNPTNLSGNDDSSSSESESGESVGNGAGSDYCSQNCQQLYQECLSCGDIYPIPYRKGSRRLGLATKLDFFDSGATDYSPFRSLCQGMCDEAAVICRNETEDLSRGESLEVAPSGSSVKCETEKDNCYAGCNYVRSYQEGNKRSSGSGERLPYQTDKQWYSEDADERVEDMKLFPVTTIPEYVNPPCGYGSLPDCEAALATCFQTCGLSSPAPSGDDDSSSSESESDESGGNGGGSDSCYPDCLQQYQNCFSCGDPYPGPYRKLGLAARQDFFDSGAIEGSPLRSYHEQGKKRSSRSEKKLPYRRDCFNKCRDVSIACQDNCSDNDNGCSCDKTLRECYEHCISNKKRLLKPETPPQDQTCCYYNNQFYIEGETIALYNESSGRNCRKLYCHQGRVLTWSTRCCCIENNEIYTCEDKPLPSSDPETCSIRRCCDGFIETHHKPGCCFVNDRVYEDGQRVGYTPDSCQIKRCVDGKIVLQDTGYCCKADGKYYRYGDVVESNPEKCILKVCRHQGTVADYTKESYPCCIYRDNLYVNGSVIHPSSCVTLECINGKWVGSSSEITCDYCYIGHFYKTFDGAVYHYDGHCNSTLLQTYNNLHDDPNNAVYLSFKRCSVPFSDALACNDILTIKHRYNIAVTVHPGGHIQINGNPVTKLPYSRYTGLFIYESAFAVRVVISSGVVIEYGKASNPDIRIYTPSKNKGLHYGLCGAYDGKEENDLQPRSRFDIDFPNSSNLSHFFNSWKTISSTCSKEDHGHTHNCSSLTEAEMTGIVDQCTEIFDVIKCQSLLNVTAYQEACVSHMCACLPSMEFKCLTHIATHFVEDCTAHGGHAVFGCDLETSQTTFESTFRSSKTFRPSTSSTYTEDLQTTSESYVEGISTPVEPTVTVPSSTP